MSSVLRDPLFTTIKCKGGAGCLGSPSLPLSSDRTSLFTPIRTDVLGVLFSYLKAQSRFNHKDKWKKEELDSERHQRYIGSGMKKYKPNGNLLEKFLNSLYHSLETCWHSFLGWLHSTF